MTSLISRLPQELLTPAMLAHLPRDLREEAVALLEEAARREERRLFFRLFRADGPRARHLYPKHLEFFAAGRDYGQRCFMAANRVGKTIAGGYETTAHVTGLYPDWWPGRVFDKDTPVKAWAAGKTAETTRDIVQTKLVGPILGSGQDKRPAGTGLIPGDLLGEWTWKTGIPNLIDTIEVKHKNGTRSLLGFKSYQQGRGAFEGTEQDLIWLDEEPPLDIYGECLIRTATTHGLIVLTFTPLDGMTETVMQFLPREMRLDDPGADDDIGLGADDDAPPVT